MSINSQQQEILLVLQSIKFLFVVIASAVNLVTIPPSLMFIFPFSELKMLLIMCVCSNLLTYFYIKIQIVVMTH